TGGWRALRVIARAQRFHPLGEGGRRSATDNGKTCYGPSVADSRHDTRLATVAPPQRETVRRAARRLVPRLMLRYFCADLDRVAGRRMTLRRPRTDCGAWTIPGLAR